MAIAIIILGVLLMLTAVKTLSEEGPEDEQTDKPYSHMDAMRMEEKSRGDAGGGILLAVGLGCIVTGVIGLFN
jgi:hypothetical protein